MIVADPRTPDAARSWVDHLPPGARPCARLARLDRPAGSWLLFWPCDWGLALAGGLASRWWLRPLFGFGAVAMRGAGCVYNDIIDRDLVTPIPLRPLSAVGGTTVAWSVRSGQQRGATAHRHPNQAEAADH